MNKTYHEMSKEVLSAYEKINFLSRDVAYFKNESKSTPFSFDEITGKIKVSDLLSLREIIGVALMLYGEKANLNFIDVNELSDFSYIFSNVKENSFKEIKIKKDVYHKFFNSRLDNVCCKRKDILTLKEFRNEREVKELSIKSKTFPDGEVCLYKKEEYNIDGIAQQIQDRSSGEYKKEDNFFEQSDYYHFELFFNKFNGVFDEWNTENLTTANCMFMNSEFNNHEICFSLLNLVSARNMFFGSEYNHPFIAETPQLQNIKGMFYNSKIEKEIDFNIDECYKTSNAFNSKQINVKQLRNMNFDKFADSYPYFVRYENKNIFHKNLFKDVLEGISFGCSLEKMFINLSKKNEKSFFLDNDLLNDVRKMEFIINSLVLDKEFKKNVANKMIYIFINLKNYLTRKDNYVFQHYEFFAKSTTLQVRMFKSLMSNQDLIEKGDLEDLKEFFVLKGFTLENKEELNNSKGYRLKI